MKKRRLDIIIIYNILSRDVIEGYIILKLHTKQHNQNKHTKRKEKHTLTRRSYGQV